MADSNSGDSSLTDPLSSPYNRSFHGYWPTTASGRTPPFVKPGWADPEPPPILQPKQFPEGA